MQSQLKCNQGSLIRSIVAAIALTLFTSGVSIGQVESPVTIAEQLPAETDPDPVVSPVESASDATDAAPADADQPIAGLDGETTEPAGSLEAVPLDDLQDPASNSIGEPISDLDNNTASTDSIDNLDNALPHDLPSGDLVTQEEQLMFGDIPIVISASRQEQKITAASAPISLITADDIHYMGFTSLADTLSFTSGVDYLQVDRNNTAIGVRGLHQISGDRTLLLINGRNANKIITGGADLHLQPVLLEDIDQIEVVHGPSGGAYGANAFNGVINIITKRPSETHGFFASGTVNEFGDHLVHSRLGMGDDKVDWRISLGYASHESSTNAIDGQDVSGTANVLGETVYSRDFARSWTVDSEVEIRLTDQTTLSAGFAGLSSERGDYNAAIFQPQQDERIQHSRFFAKLEHEAEDGSEWYVQLFNNIESTNRPSVYTYLGSETDIEVQFDLAEVDGHRVSFGGNWRWHHINPEIKRPTDFFAGGTENDILMGAFFIDRWEMTDRFTLESQVRVDWYDKTHPDWGGRISGIYALDDTDTQFVRLSGGKAFRIPQHVSRNLNIARGSVLIPPGILLAPLIAFDQPDHLRNEEIYSIEGGYSAELTDEITFRADGFYHRYNHLIGVENINQLIPPPFTILNLDNLYHADSHGVETEIAVKQDNLLLTLWYNYQNFELDKGSDASTRAIEPIENKFGLSGRLTVADDWTLSTGVRYNARSFDRGADIADSYVRWDMALAKAIRVSDGQTVELMVGVSDVLDDTKIRAADVITIGQLHETPGRTVFFRVQSHF